MGTVLSEAGRAAQTDLRRFCEMEISGLLDGLFATALRLTRQRSDAEDLVADTVVKALDSLHTLRDPACFRGWLFRILHNTFVSGCRAPAARREDCSSALQRAGDEDAESFWLFDRLHQPFLLWWGNQEQAFVDQLLAEDLVKAIDALPEGYRMVVVLADVEGFPTRKSPRPWTSNWARCARACRAAARCCRRPCGNTRRKRDRQRRSRARES